jgi:hypothetical protein
MGPYRSSFVATYLAPLKKASIPPFPCLLLILYTELLHSLFQRLFSPFLTRKNEREEEPTDNAHVRTRNLPALPLTQTVARTSSWEDPEA